MSVKIFAELNPVSTQRTEHTVDPGAIKDILTSLNSGFPLSQARVCRNGEIVTDFSLVAHDGDTLWIKFVPYGNGSTQSAGAGMKFGGWALVALGGLAIGLLGWTGIGGVLGAALIGTGLSLALGGTVLMNTSIPSLSDRETPEQDPSIRGAKNQARQHGRIPVLFGRHRVYPDLAANPHTEIIGNSQYYTQLFCGGYKDCVIDLESLKLGETALVDLSQTKNITKILADADPVISLEILQNGEASKLYPYCVHEDALNASLTHEIDDGDGNKISGEIIRTTPDDTDTINVDIFFYNGIGKYNDDGSLGSASVEVKASYKKTDSNNWQSLGFFNNSSIFNISNNIISGAELKTKRCQITKDKLEPGQYDVKIERITKDSDDSNVVDQVYVGSIRSIKSNRPIRAERQQELTIIAMRVMATAKLNGTVDSFNYVATSKLPVHAGSGSGALYWLASAETRNPAAMLLYALQGRPAQQHVDADDIDWYSLEAFYQWCQQHDYTCNAYLSESVTIAELLRMIGSTARADVLRIDSKISIVQDIERPSPMQLFTPKNTVGYSITMFNADVPDAISLRFIDKDSGYAQNERIIYNTPDGNREKEPDSNQKVDLWGVTDADQAGRIGMYNYGCLKNRPFVHVIEADIEYLLCNKGDWIQYAGDIALTGSVQGRIKGVIWADGVCIGIDTDEPVVMEAGQQYAVRIRKADGTIILKDVVFAAGKQLEKAITYYPGADGDLHDPPVGDMYVVDEDNVYYEPYNMILFTEPLEPGDAPKAGDIYAFGIRGYEILDLIITDIQPGQNLCATLTCVEYSPEIFGVDEPDFVLPAFINRITPVSGAVDSGVVNPNNWKLFAVYHDSDEEPGRPTGNGQGEGWYYVQTYRSIWQSTKMAESVDSGEWGAPVRIRAERGTDDITPIWLSLSPQSTLLECDADGNILVGLLPLTSQARLFTWTSPITDGVTFSLVDAPSGVSVNDDGVITVDEDAALDDVNNITVCAEYQGAVYTEVLVVTRDTSTYAPRYLGAVDVLPAGAIVSIVRGSVGQYRARQGDYVFTRTSGDGWEIGTVYQWTGLVWELRSAANYASLYMSCFKDGLDVPELIENTGWFGAVITQQLVAMKAFIEELQTLKITLQNPGLIQSSNFVSGAEASTQKPAAGFRIKHDGDAEFNNITARGTIYAENGVFYGEIQSGALSLTETPPQTFTYKFTTNATAPEIYETIRADGTFNATGTYGNQSISRLEITYETSSTTSGNYLYTYYDTNVWVYIGNARTNIANSRRTIRWPIDGSGSYTDTTIHNIRLSSVLSVTITRTGKTLKLIDLPTTKPTEPNIVYKVQYGDGYMLRIS